MSLYCPECRSTYSDHTMRVCPDDGTRLYVLDSKDSEDPLVGATIDGRFQVERSIGVGGMGTVYRARQLSVGRDVAVKVLRAELSGKEVALERFFREAKTISNLTHPNIVRLIDFGQDRDFDVLYLVMELVDGENLGDLLRSGRLRVALALEIAYQVCGALTEPHAAGVIHRDLKPDNLLLCPVSDGTIQTKVLDFGIARALETNDTTLTATGMICGTPAYMAPEQAQNEDLGPRTDLYALGVILYEMLSGWPPFSGTSSLQIMLKHIQEMPVLLRELLPPATLPEEVEQLVYELMNKDPSKRPLSARDVRDRIDQLRSQFDFGQVRVDEKADLEDFVLRKLPRGETSASGPTEVLRRETGMEQMLTGHQSDAWENPPAGFARDTGADTVDEMDHHTTFPFTPDEKGEVRADARVKISTREGAQQAWTPGDQPSIGRPKNTEKSFANDEVDAFSKTEAQMGTPEPMLPTNGDEPVRKTMVEPSQPAKKPAKQSKKSGATKRQPEKERATGTRSAADTSDARLPVQKSSSDGVSVPLIIAGIMTLIVGASAAFVVYEIREMNAKATPTTVVKEVPVAETTPEESDELTEAQTSAIERGASRAGFVVATGRFVGDDMKEAKASNSKRKPSRTPKDSVSAAASGTGKPEKKEPEDTSSKEKDEGKSRLENILEKKGLREE